MQAYQHHTAQAEHRNRNSSEHHGKAGNNAKKKTETSRERSNARKQSRRTTAQHDPAQHGARTQARHTTTDTTQNKPQTAAPHHRTHDKLQHRPAQQAAEGGGEPAQTRRKKIKPPAPSARGVGRATRHGSHQRQQGEEQRHQHGATGHTQHNRQQHKRGRHRQGALHNRAQAHTGPRRSTRPTTTHTNKPQCPRQTSTAPHSQHSTKKKERGKKTHKKKAKKNTQGRGRQKNKQRRGGEGPQDAKVQGTQGRKTRNAGDKGGAQEGRKREKEPQNNTSRATPAQRGPSRQGEQQEWPQEKVRRTKTRPGGRPA